MTYLKTSNVHCAFGHTKILNGISLEVTRGESVGVIGPNGSGKTTFFNCVSGYLPLTEGSIVFNDQEIRTLEPWERARHGIARVFQNPGIFRDMTVLENLQLAYEGRGVAFNRGEALELLGPTGLSDRLTNKAGNLSGGQLRLLEIVRALALGAELLLLDEPTAGVSPKMRHNVAELIHEFQRRKKTLLIIEHDISFIESLTTRIVVFDNGQLALDGSPQQVRGDPRLQTIYFGTHV